MKRFIASLLGIVMTVPTFMTPTLAMADSVTGAWTWTDISSQLTTRTNRPVWAVAYGNGSWFYTDGQDLWNGGQVYRYDGFTQTNITTDIRNAGLSRVDDIVTDGETVLFLQDIVRLDNQLSVVTYRNGQYANITSQVRSMLQSDEGVSSITGRAGEWMVITTKARLFRLTNTGSATQITLPSIVRDNVPKDRALIYNMNHGADAAYVELVMVPVGSNKWLLAASKLGYQSTGSSLSNGAQIGHSLFYSYANGSFTEAPPGISARETHAVVSNGTQALVMLETLTGSLSYADFYSFDGTSWKRGSQYASCNDRGIERPCINVNTARYNDGFDLSWNGRSWMLMNQNKSAYRIDTDLKWTPYGTMRDYFVTVAGDGNGRFLLGGAASETWTNDPTFPLTSKLVMVTEGVAAPRVLGTTTSVGGPSITVNGDPSDFRVGNGREFNYRITASDPDGVSRIDLYVNDALIRTCLSENACEYRTAYWTNGNTTRTVKFWARATDRQGNITEGRTDFLTVDLNSNGGSNGQNAGTTNTTGSIWTWMEPNQTTVYANQSSNFRVSANDADGLDRIEIMANGSTVRTCNFGNATGNRECDWTLYANNYSQGANISMNAKATDRYGNTVWSNSVSIFRANDGTVNPPTNNPPQTSNKQNPSVWDWMEPSDTTLTYASDFADYRVGAWDEDGLDRIDMYVNGSLRRTCDFNTAFGNQECTWNIQANDYTNGSDVFVNAKATDRYGNVQWTSGKTIRIQKDGTSQNDDNDEGRGRVAVFASHARFDRGDRIAFTGYGTDEDGTDRMEIFVNGDKVKTCYGNGACRVTPGAFNTRQDIRYSARVIDVFGNITETGDKYIRAN